MVWVGGAVLWTEVGCSKRAGAGQGRGAYCGTLVPLMDSQRGGGRAVVDSQRGGKKAGGVRGRAGGGGPILVCLRTCGNDACVTAMVVGQYHQSAGARGGSMRNAQCPPGSSGWSF